MLNMFADCGFACLLSCDKITPSMGFVGLAPLQGGAADGSKNDRLRHRAERQQSLLQAKFQVVALQLL
jgi:hypothetical protein